VAATPPVLLGACATRASSGTLARTAPRWYRVLRCGAGRGQQLSPFVADVVEAVPHEGAQYGSAARSAERRRRAPPHFFSGIGNGMSMSSACEFFNRLNIELSRISSLPRTRPRCTRARERGILSTDEDASVPAGPRAVLLPAFGLLCRAVKLRVLDG
jgi:hypothetical protein